MKRLSAVIAMVVLATGGVAIDAFVGDDVAGAAPATTVTVALGDEVRVQGSDLGCRVTHLAGHGRRLYVECRRRGPLAGTYGTYFGKDGVLVVRFVNRRTARVVLEAEHEASAKQCRAGVGG